MCVKDAIRSEMVLHLYIVKIEDVAQNEAFGRPLVSSLKLLTFSMHK